MIIGILILTVSLTIVGWTLPKSWLGRIITGSLGLLLTLGVVSLMTLNFTHHWGMRKVTTTTTHQIYTAGQTSSPANLLLTKALGTERNYYVMVYRDQVHQKKATAHFIPDTDQPVTAAKTTTAYQYGKFKQAQVVTKTTRWRWRSARDCWWLNLGDQSGELIKKRIVVQLPQQTWLALTTTQAKQVAAHQKTATTATTQAALKQKLTLGTQAYLKQHPKATARQVKTYQQQLLAILTIQGLRTVLRTS